MAGYSCLTSDRSHGNNRRPSQRQQHVGAEADDADDDDGGVDVVEVLVARLLGDEPGDAGAGADQLGDDQIGPGPAEQDALIAVEVGQDARDHHAAKQLAGAFRAERQGRLDQRDIELARRVGDDQHLLEQVPITMMAIFGPS